VIDEDEEAEATPTDRGYWEKKATKETVGFADDFLKILKSFDESLELKYNKFYIGIAKSGQPFNFITFRPMKKHLQIDLMLPKSDGIDNKIDIAGFDALEYARWGAYRLRLTKDDVHNKSDILKELALLAFQRRANG
jgi:hypothetical protein